jgi:HEAT repeat protein
MSSIDDTAGRLARLREAVGSGALVTNEDVTFLGQCLGHVRKNRQRAAAECLAELLRNDPQRENVLHRILQSSDPRARWGAAYAMAILGKFPVAAIDAAIELLGTDDRDLRWAAANLLERAAAADSAVLARVCDTARVGSFLQRRMALYVLRDLATGEPTAIIAAEEALGERDVELRLAGLAALVQLSKEPSRTADRVVGLLDDPELRVQRVAAAALGLLGHRSPTVMRAIERALACADPSVRRAAKRSLERLEGAGQ